MTSKRVGIRKRPTQNDVARLAQVSRGTVSMVLSGQSGNIAISDSTREKVLWAVQELGYVPDPVAQALASGSNHLIGVFTYESEFPYDKDDFFYAYLSGIERGAWLLDYNILLFTRRHSHAPSIYHGGRNSLSLADGAIILGTMPDRDEIKRLEEDGFPFVFIGRRDIPDCKIDWTASNYTEAAAEVIKPLLELGHKKFAIITTYTHTESFIDKLAGLNQAVAAYPGVSIQVIKLPEVSEPGQLYRLLSSHEITALIGAEMITLNRAYALIANSPIRIPQDLSLVSLTDGNSQLPQPLTPTYIDLNRPLVGETAIRTLVARLEGQVQRPQEVRVPCQIVPGNTTAPPMLCK